ncbi:MAG: alpha/beta fold hydrolase [Fibrobacterales bacterium]
MTTESFLPNILFRNRHVQTIFPTLFRKVAPLPYQRVEVETNDGDLLYLDTVCAGNSRAVILIHGMEGHSDRIYMRGMGQQLRRDGMDIFAMNMRGCGGENRLEKFYNAGLIEDLDAITSYVQKLGQYSEIYFVGFSLGGNLLLNFLADSLSHKYPEIKKSAVVSVPMNLESCARKLNAWYNRIYRWRFLKDFYTKVSSKAKRFPALNPRARFKIIKTLQDYDDIYTAPHGGYTSYNDYYESASAISRITDIKTPFLVMASLDDPFLDADCFPINELENHPTGTMILTEKGGHVGFFTKVDDSRYFHEERISHYFKSTM